MVLNYEPRRCLRCTSQGAHTCVIPVFSVSAIYLAFDQVMLTAGIILSVVVYNCHYRNVKRSSVPGCLKTVSQGP